jgi:hypothetical protein
MREVDLVAKGLLAFGALMPLVPNLNTLGGLSDDDVVDDRLD